MTDHAAASPSSATMWMNCPASITLAGGITRPSSRYAREGTAAHTIAQMILGGEMFPPPKITVEGEEFIVGLPMLRALNPYIDHIEELQADGWETHIEKRVALDWSQGYVWGTADCAARKGDMVSIVDLKYGKGVEVSPDSPQLKIYALASINTLWRDDLFEDIFLTVVQPRLVAKATTVHFSARELWLWAKQDLKPAIARIVLGDTSEEVGSWCRWCVRKGDCKAFRNHKNIGAADVFDDGLDTLT